MTRWCMFQSDRRFGLVHSEIHTGRFGLRAGRLHDAAHALGYKVIRIRFLAIMFGGACNSLGGAAISLIRVPQWTRA